MSYSDAQKAAYWKKKAMEAGGKPTKKYSKKYGERPKGYKKNYYAKNLAAETRANNKTSRAGWQAGGGIVGGAIGEALFPAGGLLPGSALGSMAGDALATIMGYGDYKIKKNVFMSGRLPVMHNIPKNGGCVIRFQEYLGDVYTTANIAKPDEFNIQEYNINAADNYTFPWLSQIASNFEQYDFEGMVFQYKSTSANALNSTNTALGSVMLATQYDVSDPVFKSKTEMLNYEYSNSIKPSENCLHMIECAKGQNVLSDLYTLNGAIPAGTDPRMFNLGRFCIATVGFQAANVNVGELHVTYQVSLKKPKLWASLGNMNDFWLSNFINAGPLLQPAYDNAQPWLDDAINEGVSAQSNIVVKCQSGTLTLPTSAVIKTYRFELFWIGAVGAILTVPTLTYANCVQKSIGSSPASGTTSTVCSVFGSFQTLGNSKTCSISASSATLPASPTQVIIRIMEVPQASIS